MYNLNVLHFIHPQKIFYANLKYRIFVFDIWIHCYSFNALFMKFIIHIWNQNVAPLENAFFFDITLAVFLPQVFLRNLQNNPVLLLISKCLYSIFDILFIIHNIICTYCILVQRHMRRRHTPVIL